MIAEDLLAQYASALDMDPAQYAQILNSIGIFHLIFGYLCEATLAGDEPSFMMAIHRTGTWPLIAKAMGDKVGVVMTPGDAAIMWTTMAGIYDGIVKAPTIKTLTHPPEKIVA